MISDINSILWIIITFFVIYFGIVGIKTLAFTKYKIKKMFKSVKEKDSFTILFLTLAGKIGVGSISGIALSIKIGGIGTIFWLWISTIFLVPISYFETKLGLKYKKKIENSSIGGPQVYIEQQLNKKKLAKIYSFLIILIYFVSFTSIQTNTIITSFSYYFNDKKNINTCISINNIYFNKKRN